jgi:hypothetical protein
VDFLDVVQSDEWRKVYDRLLRRWSAHFDAMQESKSWEEFIEHRARMKEVHEIMRMPLDKLPKDGAELYKEKIDRSLTKTAREKFDAG